jgi:glucose-1-phosphate thymidylyltransferase
MIPAVVLAAGRGTRLQWAGGRHRLSPAQARAADAGHKALVPIHGHPYVAYVLHELADAGYDDVCVVVRHLDDPVATALRAMAVRRLRLSFAAQPEPRGTADAVLAAESVVGDHPFIAITGDNIYPAAALAALGALAGPGLLSFDPVALVERSNIPPARVAAFALVRERDGWLEEVVEKPDAATARAMAGAGVSMTCWRFDASIFQACRAVALSPRGELELPDAVAVAMARGERFRALPVTAGVLDLSSRGDIPELERRLAGRPPAP